EASSACVCRSVCFVPRSCCLRYFFLYLVLRPQTPTLFPYTTLFRSFAAAGYSLLVGRAVDRHGARPVEIVGALVLAVGFLMLSRSEEHTSELQSLRHLVCRLLLEKKNTAPRSDKRSKHQLSRHLR